MEDVAISRRPLDDAEQSECCSTDHDGFDRETAVRKEAVEGRDDFHRVHEYQSNRYRARNQAVRQRGVGNLPVVAFGAIARRRLTTITIEQ
jgi:hypothetical protein